MAPESSALEAARAPLAVRMMPALREALEAEPKPYQSFCNPWWVNFDTYVSAGLANPNTQEPSGRWLTTCRHSVSTQSSARLLTLQGVKQLQIFPYASSRAYNHAHMVEYGRVHGHTCIPQWFVVESHKLGNIVSQVRTAKNGKKTHHRFDAADEDFYERCLRNWLWTLPRGKGALKAIAELAKNPETPEHRWWYSWAKAYLHRYHNFAFSLMTADEVAEVLGEEVWQWLAPLVANPAREIANWPQETALVRGRAIAMLELVPPAGCKPEWLPEHSLGRRLLDNPALLQLAEYLNSRWHRT